MVQRMLILFELCRVTNRFPTRSDKNQAEQPQEMPQRLENSALGSIGIVLCSNKKGADQLCGELFWQLSFSNPQCISNHKFWFLFCLISCFNTVCLFDIIYLSCFMRKPTFCICENKDPDQLHGQRLCFRYR